MSEKADVRQGTLALMVLKTLETLGPLYGYGIARRIEQTSGDLLSVNYGTLYPALLKLEQEGYIDFRVGPVRQQSQSEILPAHARRTKAIGQGSTGVGTSYSDSGAISRAT
jgi:Transcriptional regulator PadR-like family